MPSEEVQILQQVFVFYTKKEGFLGAASISVLCIC